MYHSALAFAPKPGIDMRVAKPMHKVRYQTLSGLC